MDQNSLAKYKQSADRAVEWLVHHLQNDGSYDLANNDLAGYYKSPYLFYLSGQGEIANKLLTYIKKTFMRDNGDFTTSPEIKSENAVLCEYWAYINGWITLTAQKMGRFDIAYPAYQYLKTFHHPTHGGFTTTKPYGQADNVVDILMTAHLGLTALHFGEIEIAKHAGHFLAQFRFLQPNSSAFYLRISHDSQIITDFPADSALFFVVNSEQPNQAYFMLGYPIAFLGKLYQATGELLFLETAKNYLDDALCCENNIRTFYFSHKVAWGAAIIANLTQDKQYLELATDIADYLVSIQDKSGGWLLDEAPYISFDQTAEIALWLREISAELSN
jgi:hypothetical protein